MSNRQKAFVTESNNPVAKWLEWKSEVKCFAYYDKEQGKNIEVPLPFKFLTIDEYHTVKGWHDASNSGIYANEVKNIGSEPIKVNSFGKSNIAEGLYKDIKKEVNDAGGNYYKSLYIMLEDGELCNLCIKGSAVKAWGDFTQKARRRLPDEWVSITEVEELKKGRIEYSVPIFKFDGSLTEAKGKLADTAFDLLENYKNPNQVELDEDGLPF